jgi:secreted protein with Ig-like and vWFA domain
MGEGGGKPKLKHGADQKKQTQQQWARKRAAADKKFKAPTQGLEHMIFKKGDAAYAAAFVEVKKALTKYAGVYFKVGSAIAQAAIDRLEEPDMKEPEDPKPMSSPPTIQEEKAREMWKYELEDYVKQTQAWKDAKGRAFQLVMSHVDPDLKEKLKSASQWETINKPTNIRMWLAC